MGGERMKALQYIWGDIDTGFRSGRAVLETDESGLAELLRRIGS